MTAASQALERLQDGNRRFVASGGGGGDTGPERRTELATGQQPFAAVLGCADSRVPPEIVFDQGLGDLFVVRVAGNVASSTEVGSIEYAVEHLGSTLVVVLGHTGCGAVQAALAEVEKPSHELSHDLRSIIDRVRPSIEPLLKATPKPDRPTLLHQAMRENVRASANRLRNGSRLVDRLVREGELLVVGAEYSLETGVVEFFDGA
jgi:carbonic anhydrase